MTKKIGKTICVYSAKGGVGKTTTTLCLAGIYHKLGKKVLIWDLDLTGGAIAVALNKVPDVSIYNMIMDLENNQYNSISKYVTKYNENIDFLASPLDPRQAGRIDSSYIDLILDRATLAYDIILIDTTHVINEINLSLLERVNSILFIATNDPYNLKNLKSLLSIFRDLNMNNYKVLLNQAVLPFKNYYSLYDIKNILKTNIDYTLSPRFYIKDIDNFIINGQIITLDKRCEKTFPEDFTTLLTMATDLVETKEESEYAE